MTKHRSTKQALVASLLVLTLCVSMLIGSTFAWFTDEVVSTGNKIQAGTLKIDLEVLGDDDATWTSVKDSKAPIFNYDKWEPGYTAVKFLKVENEGNLALKWQAQFVASAALSELAEVIDVYVKDYGTTAPTAEVNNLERDLAGFTKVGTVKDFVNTIAATTNGQLVKNGDAEYLGLALKMQESAGNEYQGMALGAFDIRIYATQLTSEEDFFDETYDHMATVDTEAELLEALAAGDNVKFELGANIALTEGIEIPAGKTVTIDLQGYTLSQAKAQTAAYAMILNKGNLTIMDSVGTGKISYADTTVYSGDNGYVSNTISNQGTLTVKSGTIENTSSDNVKSNGYPHAIDAYQGSVTTINGGTVKSANYDSIRMFCNSDTEATEVVINGGTIVNRVSFQDPNSTRPGYGILEINGGNFVTTEGVTANVRLLNFCANCSNMKATVNGGTFDKGFKTQNVNDVDPDLKTSDWLTFGNGFKAPMAVSSYAELKNAIIDGFDVAFVKDITVDQWIMFSETKTIGNGKIITVTMNGLTIDGNGHTLTVKSIESASNGNHLFDNASNLNIRDLTINRECAGGGAISLVSGVISNVNFVGGGYGIHPGDGEIKVENCTFATADGDAIYFEQERDNLTVTGCTFNQLDDENVILLRGDVEFTNNTVNSGRTVNIVSGSPVVTGNNFNNVRLKVYEAATATISSNTINNLEFETTTYSSTFADNTLSAAAQAALDAVTKN